MEKGFDLGDLDSIAGEEVPVVAAAGISLPSLTDKEKKKLDDEARREVEVSLKAKAMEEYKESVKKELQRQARVAANVTDDGEGIEEIRIELAKYTLYIMLDGKVYYHGYTYKFGRKQAAVIRDQIYRSWLHDAEIHGLDINEMNGRKQYLRSIGPGSR